MKLLLDEQLSPQIARDLRDRGYDVAAIDEVAAWKGLTDDQVFALACREGRAVVTNNVIDFRRPAAEMVIAGGGHYGLVLLAGNFPRRKADVGRIVQALARLLDANHAEDALANQEAWL